MDTVVPEARVTPDARLLSENVIILTLQVADNLLEPLVCSQHQRHSSCNTRGIVRELIVYIVAKARGVNDRQSNANTILFKFYTQYMSSRAWTHYERRTHTDVDGLDPDTLLNMRSLRTIADFMLQNLRLAQGVHKGRAAGTRSTYSDKRVYRHTTPTRQGHPSNSERWHSTRKDGTESTDRPP